MGTNRKLEVLRTPDRLESWKEIAVYFSRSERTVRRWEEKEGLPVHRLQHDKRGSVYAYVRELDDWRESRRSLVESEPDLTKPQASASAGDRRAAWAGGAIVLLVAAAAAAWVALATPRASHDSDVVRLVQRANSFATNTGRTQLLTAIASYQEAIRLDAEYAPAWSGLATAHVALMWFGEERVRDLAERARREAQEALRLDPNMPQPWRVLGFVSHYVDFDHDAAANYFQRSLAADSVDAAALSWFGDYHANLRKYDAARALYLKSQEARPAWLAPMTFAANVHYFTGHTDLALAEYDRILEIQPGYGFANHYRGRALLASGRVPESIAQLRKSDELLGGVPFSRADLGFALGSAGLHMEATAMLDAMVQKREAAYYPAFAIALVQLGLGNRDAALGWLEAAVDERHTGFYLPSTDPLYDSVRDAPRFRAVLARMKIAS